MSDFKVIRSIVAGGLCHTNDCGQCEDFFGVSGCPIHDCDDDAKVALLRKLYDYALNKFETGNTSWSDEEFMRVLNDES